MYELDEQRFQTVKLYCKINNTVEDYLIKTFIDAAAKKITNAISSKLNPADLENDPRFFYALQRSVKEMYEVRGESVEGNRTFLTKETYNIINQLRGTFLENSKND